MVRGGLTDAELHLVLFGIEDLFKQALQSHLAPIPALFDIGENAVEISHLRSEPLHLAEALLHIVQPLAHLHEGCLYALVESLGEFLVHGGAHLFQLIRIVRAHLVESRLHLGAHALNIGGEFLPHLAELRGKLRPHARDIRL